MNKLPSRHGFILHTKRKIHKVSLDINHKLLYQQPMYNKS